MMNYINYLFSLRPKVLENDSDIEMYSSGEDVEEVFPAVDDDVEEVFPLVTANNTPPPPSTTTATHTTTMPSARPSVLNNVTVSQHQVHAFDFFFHCIS